MTSKETIKRILKEDLGQKFMKMIDEIGLVKASQYVGFYELKRYIGDTPEFKEKIIKAIRDYIVEEHDSWLNLNYSNESFLFKRNSKTEEESIEYLSDDAAVVTIYEFINKDIGWDYVDEYDLAYEDVPLPHLEHIILLIIDNKV